MKTPRQWELGNRSQTWDRRRMGWKREDSQKYSWVDAENGGHHGTAGEVGWPQRYLGSDIKSMNGWMGSGHREESSGSFGLRHDGT